MNKYYTAIREEIESLGFNIIDYDFKRPWGAFLLIDDSQSQDFINTFISKENLKIQDSVSPKILIVNPNSRLSWQYHYRRKEIWRVYKNSVGVIRSMDNKLTKVGILGGSGFTGEELLRILSNHSRTEVIAVSSRELLGQSTNKIVEGSNLSFIEPDNPKLESDYLDEFDHLFRQAVKRNLLSDVAVSSYLSGGMDSGAITYMASAF